MKTVEAYETSDGTVFTDKEVADDHERKIMLGSGIDQFLGSESCPYPGKKHQSMIRKGIEAWEAFKISGDLGFTPGEEPAE